MESLNIDLNQHCAAILAYLMAILYMHAIACDLVPFDFQGGSGKSAGPSEARNAREIHTHNDPD